MSKKQYFIIAIILSQIFGLYGGMLQAPRLMAILALPFLLSKLLGNRELSDSKIVPFFFFYILISVISCFRVIDPVNALKDMCYALINFLLFVELVSFSNYNKGDRLKLIAGSVSMFLMLTIPVALIEILFNFHFSNSRFGDDALVGGVGVLKRYAAITFGNYNLYNHLIAIFYPFLLISFKCSSWRIKPIFILSMLLILYVLLINGSRGALLCFLVSNLIFFLFYFIKRTGVKIAFAVLFLSCLFYLFLNIFSNDEFSFVAGRISSKGFQDESRSNLLAIGLDMLIETNFFGVGAGNFSNYVERNYNSNILVPHNLFIELVSQYGILVLMLFMLLLFSIFIKIKSTNGLIQFLLITSLINFPIAFVINSVYLNNPYLWIYLACLFIASRSDSNKILIYEPRR